MFSLGSGELLLILLVALIIVGPKDLPKVARKLGIWYRKARDMYREFKKETGLDEAEKEIRGTQNELNAVLHEADPTRELNEAVRETNDALQGIDKEIKAASGVNESPDEQEE